MSKNDPLIMLRPPRDDDFGMLCELRRDLDLQASLLTVPDSLDDRAIRGWIERRSAEPGGAFRIIADAATGEGLGYAQVSQVHRRNRCGYGGVALSSRSRGKGIGRATLNALIDLSANELRLRKLLGEIRADNEAAIKMNLACGYKIVGTLSQNFWDGTTTHDVLIVEKFLNTPLQA